MIPGTSLYDGEVLETVNGFPVLYRYIQSSGSKPLMVFIPGAAHLARIFYGYPGGRPDDFISHWVTRAGFPFLAISYPVANAVFSSTHPEFTIQDWGNQAADVIAKILSENHLPSSVIVCGWSMGGKIAGALARAAKTAGFSIECLVAMAADPPLPGFLPIANVKAIEMTADGMASRSGIYPTFFAALNEQSTFNQHTIIPEDRYRSEFLGAIPVALIGTGLMYDGRGFKEDLSRALKTANTFGFLDYPIPVVIQSDSMGDLENVLCNIDDWAFIRNRVLVNKLLGSVSPEQIPRDKWELVQLLTRSSSDYFSQIVSGNHFFFVGSIGARTTVDRIEKLRARVRSIQSF
ncbi:hypothetical protein BTJ40_17800 [Microbulbifer sp. A4B17]|uniref:alpha/beta fold hydrolase n=1 Tax=Microbulbifer sp. A4B17 TaxID=359370 RepID=UPI000D52D714|nr:alpha/beta fold hydrolase [Microbulbifer sp. A4B17]AWF82516.1 hypothetical protein BTJ40_17800 [Microbulbifer sp. A4B17]